MDQSEIQPEDTRKQRAKGVYMPDRVFISIRHLTHPHGRVKLSPFAIGQPIMSGFDQTAARIY